MDTQRKISLTVPPLRVSMSDLAGQVSSADRDDVLTFLVAVDAHVGDYHFTLALRDKLNEALADEDGTEPNTVATFLRWLVRMDDPADEQGIKDRQTIRLSTIIDRARDLLGGA